MSIKHKLPINKKVNDRQCKMRIDFSVKHKKIYLYIFKILSV